MPVWSHGTTEADWIFARCRPESSKNGSEDEQDDRMIESEVQPGEVDSTAVSPDEPAERTAEATCKAEEAERNSGVSTLSELDEAVTAKTEEAMGQAALDEAVTVKTEEAMGQAADSRGCLSSWSHLEGPARTRLFWKALLAALVFGWAVGVAAGWAAAGGAAATASVPKRPRKVSDDAVCGKEEPNGLRGDLEARRGELDEAREEVLRAIEAQRGPQRDPQVSERRLFLAAVLGAAAVVFLLLMQFRGLLTQFRGLLTQFREAREEAVQERKVLKVVAATRIEWDGVNEALLQARAFLNKLQAMSALQSDGVRERQAMRGEPGSGVRERAQGSQERTELTTRGELDETTQEGRLTRGEVDETTQEGRRERNGRRGELERKLATAVAFVAKTAKGINGITQSDAKAAVHDAIFRRDLFFGTSPTLPDMPLESTTSEDNEWQVGCCAMKTLGEVADRGSPAAIAIIEVAVKTALWPLRSCALRALEEVGDRGCPKAMAIVREAMKDRVQFVRSCAVAALGGVADRGSSEALAIVRETMKDAAMLVRYHAVAVLRKLADRGSPEAMAIMRDAVKDSDWGVRRCAVITLGHMAGRRSPEARAIIREALKDSNTDVQLGAAEALAMADGPQQPGGRGHHQSGGHGRDANERHRWFCRGDPNDGGTGGHHRSGRGGDPNDGGAGGYHRSGRGGDPNERVRQAAAEALQPEVAERGSCSF